jgi:hypothetical protein
MIKLVWLNLQKKINMKFSILLLSVFAIAACNDKTEKNAGNDSNQTVAKTDHGDVTTIQWIDSVKNLGKINEGQKLEIAFRFKNTGNKPLVIESVRPGCGCTVAEYPKKPIAPGSEGEITGSFDSHGRQGIQNKDIFVTANTAGSQNHTLHFTVEVLKPKS